MRSTTASGTRGGIGTPTGEILYTPHGRPYYLNKGKKLCAIACTNTPCPYGQHSCNQTLQGHDDRHAHANRIANDFPTEAPATPASMQVQIQKVPGRNRDACILHRTLSQSDSPMEHVSQLLASFSPAMLERYLQCMESFLEMWNSQSQLNNGAIEKAAIADYLLAGQRSATQDRAPHRTSPLTALTS